MAWLCLCLLVGVALWAPALPLVSTRLLRAFGLYMFIAFIGRTLYLFIVNPAPLLNVPVADSLIYTPTYWSGVQPDCQLAAIGLAAILASVYAITYGTSRWIVPDVRLARPAPLILVGLYAVSWLSRLLTVAGGGGGLGPLGVVVTRLVPLGTALLAYVVIKTDWRADQGARRRVYIFALGEVLWSLLYASKTPLLAAALALYVDPGRARLNLRSVGLSVIAFIGAFGVVQTLKPGASTASSHGLFGVLQALLTRFDLLHATAIARQRGAGSYMSLSTAAGRFVSDLIPQQLLGISRASDGQNWARVMEHTIQGVALATGPAAEGYAVAGVIGVCVFSVATAAALVVTSDIIASSGRLIPALFGCYVLTSNSLFEQGALGIIDSVSSALQACAVSALVASLMRSHQTAYQPMQSASIRSRGIGRTA